MKNPLLLLSLLISFLTAESRHKACDDALEKAASIAWKYATDQNGTTFVDMIVADNESKRICRGLLNE